MFRDNYYLTVRELIDQQFRVVHGNANKLIARDIVVTEVTPKQQIVSMDMNSNHTVLLVIEDYSKPGLFLGLYDDINKLSCSHHFQGVLQ